MIQSIPSPKAEPFKRWLAAVGAERIEETINPEQAIDRALETYQRKGLKKENLRDNMSDMELILNMLAESTVTNISKKEKPDTFDKSKDIANRGGKVARQARIAVEIETGDSVVTNQNAVQLNEVITDLIENVLDIRKEE